MNGERPAQAGSRSPQLPPAGRTPRLAGAGTQIAPKITPLRTRCLQPSRPLLFFKRGRAWLQQPLVGEKNRAEASSRELAGAVPAQQAASLDSSAG